MVEYLQHCWTSDLAQHYEVLGLTLAQFNKLIKLAQYSFGLFSIFELIQFSAAMKKMKVFTHIAIFTIQLPHLLFNSVNLLIRLVVGVFAWVSRQMSLKEVVKSIFVEHVLEAADTARAQASNHYLAKMFSWLEHHPLSDNWRKGIVFTAFALLSLFDLFTS